MEVIVVVIARHMHVKVSRRVVANEAACLECGR